MSNLVAGITNLYLGLPTRSESAVPLRWFCIVIMFWSSTVIRTPEIMTRIDEAIGTKPDLGLDERAKFTTFWRARM